MAACPGCGRCKECGQPFLSPPARGVPIQPYVPGVPPGTARPPTIYPMPGTSWPGPLFPYGSNIC